MKNLKLSIKILQLLKNYIIGKITGKKSYPTIDKVFGNSGLSFKERKDLVLNFIEGHNNYEKVKENIGELMTSLSISADEVITKLENENVSTELEDIHPINKLNLNNINIEDLVKDPNKLSNKDYEKLLLNALGDEILVEQAIYRFMVMKESCVANKVCPCNCECPMVQLSPNSCSEGCFPEFMGAEDWEKFKKEKKFLKNNKKVSYFFSKSNFLKLMYVENFND